MSNFPCLEKEYIHSVINSHESELPNSWRGHLNSEILDKYLEIKRYQQQKIAQILPRYHIFPKNFNTYNICTNQYEIDRLQRIKNSSNAKYANNPKSRQKKSNSQQHEDIISIKSVSQVFPQNSIIKRPGLEEENRSALRFNHSKSTKSLTQTQISPSKLSKKFNHRNPSKNANQSDSQLSGQRHEFYRQIRKQGGNKSWTSNGRSQKNAKGYKNDPRMQSNAESAVTVVKKDKNGRRNQQNEDYYYGPDSVFNRQNMRTTVIERQESTIKSQRSAKNLLYYHQQNQYEIGRNNKRREQTHRKSDYDRQEQNIYGRNNQRLTNPEELIRKQTIRNEGSNQNQNESNYLIDSPFNPKYKKNHIQGNNNRIISQNQDENQLRILESRQRNFFDERTKEIKLDIIRNQSYQGSSKVQKIYQPWQQAHGESSSSKSIVGEENYENSPKQADLFYSISNINKNNSFDNNNDNKDEGNFDLRNTFSKNPTKDNETQISNIQQKLLEYYGDEFDRIKAQRDYLRKHFIEHLERHHSDKLPYKHLTEIKVDETGKKLIISQKTIPFSKQEKDNQVFHAQIVEYAQKKRKK